MKKIAIIGFGAAGYCAAKEAREHDPNVVIDVYSDTDMGPYNPMLTTYYVKKAIPYEALFPFGNLDDIVRELDINFFANQPVIGLKPAEKTICFADGSEKQYDSILISTGAIPVMPPLPGMDLPGIIKMRTVEDAVGLRGMLDRGEVKSALVVGASWVGVKVVEDLVERGIECTLVDGAKWMFYTAAFEETAKRVQANLEAKGVRVECNQMLDHIEQEANGQLTAVMEGGDSFTADIVAICIGMRANVGFLCDSGLAINQAIVVDSKMQTNYGGIYAAGDCCEALDTQSGTTKNIAIWFNARSQGEVAGANMVGVRKSFDANVLVNLAYYLDYDFVSVGDVSLCTPEDEVYEYEDENYYIRGVKKDGVIKCMNLIGSADSNGLVKNIFLKAFVNKDAKLDDKSICYLMDRHFPDSFMEFIGGYTID